MQGELVTLSEVNQRNGLGQVTQSTDINGVVTNALYDSFGRQQFSGNSLGQASWTVSRFKDSKPSDWPRIDASMDYYQVTEQRVAGAPSQYQYLDRFGRTLAKVKQGFAAGDWIYQYSRYDLQHRLIQSSTPSDQRSASAHQWQSTRYDDLSRVSSSPVSYTHLTLPTKA